MCCAPVSTVGVPCGYIPSARKSHEGVQEKVSKTQTDSDSLLRLEISKLDYC